MRDVHRVGQGAQWPLDFSPGFKQVGRRWVMSLTFTKLFSSITESTVWCEPDRTRLCWITMLAMADSRGRVWASIPGLANRARIPVEDARVAIATFLAPDPDSRSPENEGRRIEVIDGGWRLVNHEKYRAIRDEDSRRDYQREWDRSNRKRAGKNPTNPTNSDHDRPQPTQAEAEADKPIPSADAEGVRGDAAAPAAPAQLQLVAPISAGRLPCPHERLIALYHEVLPACPAVREWNKTRRAYMQSRWREKAKASGSYKGYRTVDEGIAYWRKFFKYVGDSRFLTGRAEGRNGGPPFMADLEWLMKANNFAKVVEGKYHDAAA